MHEQINDTKAILKSLFRKELDALYRFALTHLKDPAEAEDAVQDAFIRIAQLDPDSIDLDFPRALIFSILRNLCIDRLRVRGRHTRTFVDSDASGTETADCAELRTPESNLIASDTLSHVVQAMNALPDDLAETMSLIVVEGLSYRETALVTGVPLGTVRSRLNRARQMLRKHLLDTQERTHRTPEPARGPLIARFQNAGGLK